MKRSRAGSAPEPSSPVRRIVAYQWDPTRPSLGGVDTCLRGMATYRPDEEETVFVGVDATGSFQLGVWTRTQVASSGRELWFLPVARFDPDERRRAVPHGVRLAWGLWRFRRTLPEARIVQAHKLESASVLRMLRPRAHFAYFIHSQGGALAARGSDSRWKLLGGIHRWWERRLVRRASSVVVFNPEYAVELSAANPHVHSIPTWFDPALLAGDAAHDPHHVIWIGRLEPPKDAPLALAAFRELLAREYDVPWRLSIVGSGSERALLDEELATWDASDRSRVQLHGALDPRDVAKVRATGGVLLMTTQPGYEGYPRVLVEGLASGLPAVVTRGVDTGGLITDGENGQTCGREPAELAEAITKSLGLDRAAVAMSVAHLDGRSLVPSIYRVTDAAEETS